MKMTIAQKSSEVAAAVPSGGAFCAAGKQLLGTAAATSKMHRLLFILPFFLTACMVGPDYTQPTAPAPTAYKDSGPWKPATPKDDTIRGPWWEMYHDQQLSALESQVRETPGRKPRRIHGALIHCKSKKPIALTNAEIEALLT